MSFMLFRVLSCVVVCSCLSSASSMDSKPISPQRESRKFSNCDCGTGLLLPSSESLSPFAKPYKNDETEGNLFSISGLGQLPVARIESEDEIMMLRETVNKQQQTMLDLFSDLEEERNASSSAANEAMSMILRLQSEKAEAQMAAMQFKRLAEERIEHDQKELSALQELLYKREQVIQSLTCEVQAYKHRLMSFGLAEEEADCELNNNDRVNEEYFDPEYEEMQAYDYPPLKCNHGQVEDEENDDVLDIEKYPYPFGETPRLKSLMHHMDDSEKAIVGQSPRRIRHFRRFSTDSVASMGRDPYFDVPTDSPRTIGSLKLIGHVETLSKLKTVRDASEEGDDDDMSDRVYTVDYIPNTVRTSRSAGTLDDYFTTPRSKESFAHWNVGDPDIKRLYSRLQALEADREAMRHEIMSMQTDKTQLLLLKEIAECLCERNNVSAPETALLLPPAKKLPFWRRFSIIYVFKWIGSTLLWWRKQRPCKYTFGMSAHHVGLLILLDMSLRQKRFRCFTKAELRG